MDAPLQSLFDATLTGGAGDDRIDGSDGGERILGLAGDDLLQGFGGSDLLSGGTGDDTLLGGSGDDTLLGSGGYDSINGGSGDDFIFESQAGVDTIEGGSGRDTLSYANAKAGVVTQLFSVGEFVVQGIDVLIGSNFNDTFVAGAGGDVLWGMDGNDNLSAEGFDSTKPDILIGGRGDDMLNGSSAPSRMLGGAGDDDFRSSFVGDTLSGGKGADFFDLLYDQGGPTEDQHLIAFDDSDTISLRLIDGGGWKVVGAFGGHHHEAMLSYDSASDVTSLLLDLDGDAAPDLTVLIEGDHSGFHHFVL